VAPAASDDVKSCKAHPKCKGLEGDCCPDALGSVLACCETECTQHPQCKADGLEGFCCPTAGGVTLACCSKVEEVEEEHKASQYEVAFAAQSCKAHPKCKGLDGDCCPNAQGAEMDCCEAKCTEHPKCKAASLEGSCCPTAAGVMLGCCSTTQDAKFV